MIDINVDDEEVEENNSGDKEKIEDDLSSNYLIIENTSYNPYIKEQIKENKEKDSLSFSSNDVLHSLLISIICFL